MAGMRYGFMVPSVSSCVGLVVAGATANEREALAMLGALAHRRDEDLLLLAVACLVRPELLFRVEVEARAVWLVIAHVSFGLANRYFT